MNTKSLFRFSVLAIMFVSILSSCKKNYETPAEPSDPNMQATMSIKALKARHTVAGAFDIINDDVIIAGVVIASDKSGNFYKEIYIRDVNKDSGCIALQLASSGLYANYPVGRKIFIKCKGMCLSDYHNMIQLGIKSTSNGLVSLEGIPAPIITNYVVGGSLGNDASPKAVTAADMTLLSGNATMQTPLLGNLIKLSGYEFLIGDTKRSYADTSYYHSTLGGQVNVKSCDGSGPFIVMTSGYADFASKAPQAGNGDISAIYTAYNTTKQLIIRDTTDVKFNGFRCNFFEENFGGYTTTTSCLSISGWQNIKESGDVCYTLGAFSGTSYAKISAFTSTALPTTNIKTWLITPGIDLPAGSAPKFSYTCASRYTVGTLKAFASTNYNGTSQTPSTATWDELNSIQANSTGFTAFLSYPTTGSGYDLSAYAGKKTYIAFRYDAPAATSAGSVATYEVSGIKVTKN